MSAASATLAGRAAAERLMVDACTVTRVTGTTSDGETGRITETLATIYSGKCRIRQRAATGSRTDVGEASVVQVGYELQLPMSATAVRVEDRVTVTASVLDASLVGRRWHVSSEAAGSHLTARRLQITEVDS